MHQLVGSQNIDKLDAIQIHLHKTNIIKEEYINYLKVMIPVLAARSDEKTSKELLKKLWAVQFSEEETDPIKETKEAFEGIKKHFKNIIELEGEELYANEQDQQKLNSFTEWMK